ncbi:hypothetical protein DPMN_160773 [Dreissena polymorpha]|uniref:Helicase C-terminal domain-containing protein n=1 Tax=Dreissena polymorpha TaxID=45954 RepID=A0A9D4ISV6_DREPO|nr:hypothetical protein DPMN_160773 [Dreissena polymorpha]
MHGLGHQRPNFERFSSDSTIKVVVCTIAFGMGISIPNVEIVLHWVCPKNRLHIGKSLEEQED